jgi:hypothetical protein
MGGLAATLLACSPPEPKDTSVIGEPLQRALDRAEAVELTVTDRAKSMRRELEQAEGANRPSN